MIAMASTCCAVCGSQSDTHAPDWPYCFHVRLLGISGALYSPMGVMTGAKLEGSGFPARSTNFGFGSKRSMWLGPPSINKKMTLLALGR